MDTSTPAPAPRLDWLDNVRIALIALVVVHHAAQAYGPADWWYVENQPRTSVLGTLSAFDGAFFMSLFFFISAYFVPASYDRRGGRPFLTGRLKRLGIPVVVGALTLVPGLMYAYYVRYRDYPAISFPRYFTDVYLGLGEEPADWSGPSWPDLQFGHLWFIQNLLAYSVLYLLCRQAARLLHRRRPRPRTGARPARGPVPGHGSLVLLTVAVTAATFAIRLHYPLDEWIPFLDFIQVEPARVAQYATFFALGIVAFRQDWLNRLPARVGWIWLGTGAALTAVLFAVGSDAGFFGPGGANGPSLLWSAYESALCTALITGLLVLFRERLTAGNRLSRAASSASYTVYIVHVPVVVALQLALSGSGLQAPLSFGLVAALALLISFPLADRIRRLPAFRRVL